MGGKSADNLLHLLASWQPVALNHSASMISSMESTMKRWSSTRLRLRSQFRSVSGRYLGWTNGGDAYSLSRSQFAEDAESEWTWKRAYFWFITVFSNSFAVGFGLKAAVQGVHPKFHFSTKMSRSMVFHIVVGSVEFVWVVIMYLSVPQWWHSAVLVVLDSVSVQSHLANQQPVAPMSGNNLVNQQHQDPTKSIQWQISTSLAPASASKDFNYTTQTSGSSGLVATASSGPVQGKMPQPIREFLKSLDDQEWQSSLYTLLQNQTFNQVEVDLFELMCKVLDQNLFAQVDWARNSYYFKELKVDDQMKLLQEAWSEMLILDHIQHRMHNNLPDETQLPNGQKFELLSLALLGVPSMAEKFLEVTANLKQLNFDTADYVCLKFVLLLNASEVRNLNNRAHVQECSEQVHQILMEYCHSCYPNVPVSRKKSTEKKQGTYKRGGLKSAVIVIKWSFLFKFNTYSFFKYFSGSAKDLPNSSSYPKPRPEKIKIHACQIFIFRKNPI